MRFRTKDLLVTVLPKAEAASQELAKVCLLHTAACINPTLCHIPSLCLSPTQCPYHTLCRIPTLCHHPSLCGPCSQLISCPGGTCIGGTCIQTQGGCGFFGSCGGPGGSACDPTYFCIGGSQEPWFLRDREDIVALRAELQETLKQLDELEKSGIEGEIRSKADAEAMERSLTEALEKVQALKKKLK